jgi:acyl transferase domain-containing protein
MDDDSDELLRLVAQQVELANQLKARIQELEDERTAPLAIVSTALRLPGGLTTPEGYWQFLLGDRDVAPRICDVAAFDPAFFGMSQHEAEHTDPRQRLLLHTAWEAFERAGVAVRRHDRLNAGVFIGITADEYSERLEPADRIRGDAAGRISQQIGLTGPAVSVDTACSSSLVALHLAAQALRRGECRYALAGGASLLSSSGRTDDLAPDGRCKPFTAAADGHARGEGVGVVLVMRLRDAEQEGRPIQAILRGSAVLHAGTRTSTDAAGHEIVRASLDDACAAQQEVIRAALADAAIAAHEIGVVETHATGSPLGDPIEVAALDEVIGAAAPQRLVRALLSTLKPRLGHLDGAAGIAALIKVVLMLQHGVVPAAVPLEAGVLTEFVPWDHVHLLVPRVHSPWPIEYGRRVAGVSSFGESGTNAHAILEAYVPSPTEPPPSHQAPPRPQLITLCARNATSLTEMVVALSSYLVATPPEKLASVAHTLHVGRTPFEHRVSVIGGSGSDLAEKLAVAVGHSSKPSRADNNAATTGTTQTTIILRVGSGVVRLSGAINALIAAYPLLAPIVGACDLPPAERLKRLMLHFGLRVKSERLGRASGAAAAEIAWSDQVLPLITDDTDETPTHLLHILAALFTAGADLRLDALRQPGARIVDDLPTYSFRKKRCWIDERTADADDPTPAAAAAPHEPDRRLVRDFLLSELMNVVPARNAFDPTLTFIELGGDSFAAMQLTVSIEERYGVEIPLDEFNGDLQAGLLIDRLAHRIAQVMDWTAHGVTHEDEDPCPPSYLDVSCPPPSTQTSYAPSWTGSGPA